MQGQERGGWERERKKYICIYIYIYTLKLSFMIITKKHSRTIVDLYDAQKECETMWKKTLSTWRVRHCHRPNRPMDHQQRSRSAVAQIQTPGIPVGVETPPTGVASAGSPSDQRFTYDNSLPGILNQQEYHRAIGLGSFTKATEWAKELSIFGHHGLVSTD